MNTLVLYETQFGNTRHVAELVARQLETYGRVQLAPTTAFNPVLFSGVDLLLVGGPTQAHGITTDMRRFLIDLRPPERATSAAAFDTRVRGPRFLWGSAAREISIHLERNGFRIVAEPESFLVTLSKEPALYGGEEEHARRWAARVGSILAQKVPAPAP